MNVFIVGITGGTGSRVARLIVQQGGMEALQIIIKK